MTDEQQLKRRLLAVYLLGVLLLLVIPLPGSQLRVFGIQADKWVHVALLGGFALLLRWNLSSSHRGSLLTIVVTLMVAAAIEGVQSFTTYRSAEFNDFWAGAVGALLGVFAMSRILLSKTPDKLVGGSAIILGAMLACTSLLADAIGTGNRSQFGIHQIAGVLLGTIVLLGGVLIYRKFPVRND